MNIYHAIDINIQDRIDALSDGNLMEAEPAFYRIALELSYLHRLSNEGWWQDWGGCSDAENLLRDFGPIVVRAAATCETGASLQRGTIDLIFAVMGYLSREANTHGEAAKGLNRTARLALYDLMMHLSDDADFAEAAAESEAAA